MPQILPLSFNRVLDSNGDPVSGAKIHTYAAGTSTDLATYQDSAFATAHANPIICNSSGQPAASGTQLPVFLQAKSYKFVIKDASDVTLFTIDNYSGELGAVTSVSDLTALKALAANASSMAFMKGRTNEGDGGEGLFEWLSADQSTNVTNDPQAGIYVPPNSDSSGASGAWKRQFDGEILGGWYGVVADGTTDDATATNDALAAAAALNIGGVALLPGNGHVWKSKVTIPVNTVLRGLNERTYVNKGYNGDLLDMSNDYCALENITFQGEGATYTGRGVLISDGVNQRMTNVKIYDVNGYALEFTVADKGNAFQAQGCEFRRTTTTNPAIKLPSGTTETSGNRRISDCDTGGGTLIDTDGGENTIINGCNFVTLTHGTDSLKTVVTGCRIAALSGTITVNGGDHVMQGNSIAGDIVLSTNAQRCRIGPNALLSGSSVTDNSTVTGSNINYIWNEEASFTPTWTGATTDPAIGNGNITGYYTRIGRRVTVEIRVAPGSTTTFGSGDWTFGLPSPLNRAVAHNSTGTAWALDNGTAFRVGVTRVSSGSAPAIQIASDGAGTYWKDTVPHTWSGSPADEINLSITYEIG